MASTCTTKYDDSDSDIETLDGFVLNVRDSIELVRPRYEEIKKLRGRRWRGLRGWVRGRLGFGR